MANQSKIYPKIGDTPRADFLPPQVKILHDARSNRRRLGLATAVVAIVSAASFFACQSLLFASQGNLENARAQTDQILTEQSQYSDIVSLVDESKKLGAAKVVTSANEVDWSEMSKQIMNALPAGARIRELRMYGISSVETSTVADQATRAPQLATINVSIDTPTFAGVEYFLLDARQWPGYLNSSVASVQISATGFKANLLIGLGQGALVSANQSEDDAKVSVAK
jgi:hypothetical protein